MTPEQQAQVRKKEIQLIQMGRAYLHQDDDTYRAMLAGMCGGKTSSKDLNWQERKKVLDHYKACGFVIKSKTVTGGAHEDAMSKLRAIWYALAEAGAVRRWEV